MDIKINENTVIVFDLDDTLYNELDFLKSAYRYIAKFLEPQNWTPLYAHMFSLYRAEKNVFTYLAEKYNTEVKTLIELYRNHNPVIHLFDDVLEVMHAIKVKNGKLGIITDGRVKTQSAKLKALNIENLFDEIVISEAIGTEKPNEANYKAIENSITGSEYYYIADNIKKDFVSPNALGWKTIGLIDNGLNIHNNAHLYFDEAHLPQFFIESYKDIKLY
jgi:putative hydrolase of the HAD superfamily